MTRGAQAPLRKAQSDFLLLGGRERSPPAPAQRLLLGGREACAACST